MIEETKITRDASGRRIITVTVEEWEGFDCSHAITTYTQAEWLKMRAATRQHFHEIAAMRQQQLRRPLPKNATSAR